VSGVAARAVRLAGLEGPEAALVAGGRLVGQVEGRVAGILAGAGARRDGRDPELLPHGARRVGVGIAVLADAGEHDPEIAPGRHLEREGLVVALLVDVDVAG